MEEKEGGGGRTRQVECLAVWERVRTPRFMRHCRPAQCRARAQTTPIPPVPSSRSPPACSAPVERHPGKMGPGWTSVQCMRVVSADLPWGGLLSVHGQGTPREAAQSHPHLPLSQTSPSQRMLFVALSLSECSPLAPTPRTGSVCETGFREASFGPATAREERHAPQPLAPCRQRLIRRSSGAAPRGFPGGGGLS